MPRPSTPIRQREVAAINQLRGIYTPQVVLNGKDWPGWHGSKAILTANKVARVSIMLKQVDADRFEARVASAVGAGALFWSAYWTGTENGHNSKVQAGEKQASF